MEKETRILKPTDKLQFRAIEEDGKKFIEGYAAVFEQRSKLIFDWAGLYFEEIQRGAFDEILQDDSLDVVFTFNHDRDKVMARTVSNTLQLSVDEYGLKYRAEMPNVSYGNDVYELVKRGDLYENSFVFGVAEEDQTWTEEESGDTLRRINKVRSLYDVSVVTNGAYANTEVAARQCKDFQCSIKEEQSRKEIQYKNESDKDKLKLLKLKR